MSKDDPISAKERDLYLDLFIRFVDEGKTPPMYLLEFMADGARRYREAEQSVGENAKREPWPTERGRDNEYQDRERRKLAVILYALKTSGIKQPRLSEILGKKDPKTIRAAVNQGEAMRMSVNDGGKEYRWLLTAGFDHPDLITREREMIRQRIKEYDQQQEAERLEDEGK